MDPVHTIPPTFIRIHFHILPPIPLSPQQYWFPHQNPVCTSLLPPNMPHSLPFSALIILVALVRNTEYKALLYAVFYSLLSLFRSPMYFLSTLFLNTLRLCSSLCARNQVSSFVYFNPCIHRQNIGDKRFWTRW